MRFPLYRRCYFSFIPATPGCCRGSWLPLAAPCAPIPGRYTSHTSVARRRKSNCSLPPACRRYPTTKSSGFASIEPARNPILKRAHTPYTRLHNESDEAHTSVRCGDMALQFLRGLHNLPFAPAAHRVLRRLLVLAACKKQQSERSIPRSATVFKMPRIYYRLPISR